MAKAARHVSVYGRVQGVFFRSWMRDLATELGVTGWVRNCPDGRVDSHIEGEEAAVQKLIDRLHRGPPSAHVEDVHVWNVELFDFEDFEVRH
jgi:acylphosphatase